MGHAYLMDVWGVCGCFRQGTYYTANRVEPNRSTLLYKIPLLYTQGRKENPGARHYYEGRRALPIATDYPKQLFSCLADRAQTLDNL